MTDDTKLEEQLEAFAARARRVIPDCDNEEQTKISLINPYLELLGYDVRDPAVCRLEYAADIGKAGERVDYAIMRGGQPSILVEAKAATVDLSAQALPSQLQRYFMAVKADFAAYTNGVVWQWYRSLNGYELDRVPFLVHDVRSPNAAERRWLRSVSGPAFDPARAHDLAEDAHIASAIMNWIGETRHRPSDALLRLIVQERSLGRATAGRIEQVRRSFVPTFRTYIDNEIDSRFDAARDRQSDEVGDQAPAGAALDDDSTHAVDLGDGGKPLSSGSFERAWRVRGEAWRRCASGRALVLDIARYLARLDARGRERFYAEAVHRDGGRIFRPGSESRGSDRRVEPDLDVYVRAAASSKGQQKLLARLCEQVQRFGGLPVRFGEDIEVLIGRKLP